MAQRKKIGILGGAFDPIHLGHLQLAQVCQQALCLEEVRFIPSKSPVLKNASVATAEQRAAMVALAIQDEPSFMLDSREIDREAPSYALLTLQSLQQDFPQAGFYWLMGEDALADFKKWYQWQEILKLCQIVVVTRAGFDTSESSDVPAIRVPMENINVASREIRQDIYAHWQEIPKPVQEYILAHNLYR
jgi:nicotinate (nicotinamide) nucleotide adenylyltransferase